MRDRLRKVGRAAGCYPQIIGESTTMREVLRLLDKIVETEEPVLILGESGTGKELIARAIHAHGPRARQAVRQRELRRAARDAARERAVRPRAAARSPAPTSTRRACFELADRRHAVPRRGRRHDVPTCRRSSCACCRRARSGRVGGSKTVAGRRADHRGDATATSRALVAEGDVPRGPLLPPQRVLTIDLPPLRERRRTSRSWSSTSCKIAAPRGAAPRGASARARARGARAPTTGRATSASSRTRSSAWWRSPTR